MFGGGPTLLGYQEPGALYLMVRLYVIERGCQIKSRFD
jgi:hypothetical protein